MAKITQEDKAEIRGMIERMAIAYGMSIKALPELFNVGAKSMNNWVHYGRRPYEQIRECHLKTGVSTDWLLFGKGSCKPKTDNSDVENLVALMDNVLKGAVEYKTIDFRYDDAKANILNKLRNDLNHWFESKTVDHQTNGDNN